MKTRVGSTRDTGTRAARVLGGAGGGGMRFVVGALVAVLLAGAAVAFAAEPTPAASPSWRPKLTWLISERLRGEFVDWFEPAPAKAPAGAQHYGFFASQLRVGARLTVPHAQLTVQLQDTRLVNLPDDASLVPPEGNLGPGALYVVHTRDRDQGEPFLKLAHLTLTDVGVRGLGATLGRFEYSDGLETTPTDPALAWLKKARIGERLIGPFGYTHVSRSFDGARIVYDQPRWNLTALASRPTHGGFEVSANRQLTEVNLAGLTLTLKEGVTPTPTDFRGFYLYYEDGRDDPLKVDNRPRDVRLADHKHIAVHTMGGHALVVAPAGPGKIDGLAWTALQEGRWGDLDHRGWAYAFEAGYQLPKVFAAPWLRVGYGRSSGDDDPGDDDHTTFFQLLPTARIYAQFPFFNLMNNQDLFGQVILKPHPKVTLRTDYSWLRLTERADLWYAGGGATNAQVFGFSGIPSTGRHELAHLVDVALSVTLHERVSAYAYYGHAFGQGVVRGTFLGADADYGYVELTFKL